MPKASEITLATTLGKAEQVLSSSVDDGLLLMDMDTGDYHHFDDIASSIWSRIDGEKSVGDVCLELQDEFQVDPAQCEEDTLEFLRQAHRANLVADQSA
tara:strand:- start:1511 stop:1807 length:297 start_codon:yes stop_codon:yes gene_type:complete